MIQQGGQGEGRSGVEPGGRSFWKTKLAGRDERDASDSAAGRLTLTYLVLGQLAHFPLGQIYINKWLILILCLLFGGDCLF